MIGEEMADVNEKIIFDTGDGSEAFYVLEQTTIAGTNYILVTDDMESEEADFLVLREEQGTDRELSYVVPEDDEEIKAVIKVFNELLDDVDLEV